MQKLLCPKIAVKLTGGGIWPASCAGEHKISY